jgi:hypothetical protein
VLSAIGAAPHLTRPNLPAPARHYPAGVNLTLVPFGEPALQHFMFLERPEGMALEGAKGIDAPVHEAVPLMAEGDIVPRLLDFATVGHLYRSIEQGLAHLAEKFGERNLFVGPPRAQATSTDFRWPELVAVTDLASAQRALDNSIPLIGDRVTSLCTDRFNVSYEILLQILERYFAHTEETDAQLGTLANAAVTLMGGVLGPLGDLITTLPVGPEHPGRNAGPSFELFYEDDDLLPHRESAWALLEERVRDASTFCGAVIKNSPEQVATALGPAQCALTAVADSLAAHFGDWGAASRFTSGDGADSPRMPGSDEPIGFEQQIKPLFRERDRDSMRFSFDLWSLEDVSTHADAILHRLDAGTMPCDGAWPAERVAVFRRWIDAGKPA